jgi:hypothetical protein
VQHEFQIHPGALVMMVKGGSWKRGAGRGMRVRESMVPGGAAGFACGGREARVVGTALWQVGSEAGLNIGTSQPRRDAGGQAGREGAVSSFSSADS